MHMRILRACQFLYSERLCRYVCMCVTSESYDLNALRPGAVTVFKCLQPGGSHWFKYSPELLLYRNSVSGKTLTCWDTCSSWAPGWSPCRWCRCSWSPAFPRTGRTSPPRWWCRHKRTTCNGWCSVVSVSEDYLRSPGAHALVQHCLVIGRVGRGQVLEERVVRSGGDSCVHWFTLRKEN